MVFLVFRARWRRCPQRSRASLRRNTISPMRLTSATPALMQLTANYAGVSSGNDQSTLTQKSSAPTARIVVYVSTVFARPIFIAVPLPVFLPVNPVVDLDPRIGREIALVVRH